MTEEEDWEREYPEGSLGWKINQKLAAIADQPLKSGLAFLLASIALFTPVAIEILFQPFLKWRLTLEPIHIAQWNAVLYAVTLFWLAAAFLYISIRLFRSYLKFGAREN